MTALCLDTSAYSHFKRGVPSAVEAVSTARRLAVPVVVLGELRAGFSAGVKAEGNEHELQLFLANPVVEILDVDEVTSILYAEIIHHQRRIGRPCPTNDLWIAALAAREALPILTYDAHFRSIARVSVRLLKQ